MDAQTAIVSGAGSAAPADGGQDMERTVSLRELNQRSGHIVADVVRSEQPVTITDRGRPVARIVPLSCEETPLERLRREGRVTGGHRRRVGPFPTFPMPPGLTLEQLLDEDRDEPW